MGEKDKKDIYRDMLYKDNEYVKQGEVKLSKAFQLKIGLQRALSLFIKTLIVLFFVFAISVGLLFDGVRLPEGELVSLSQLNNYDKGDRVVLSEDIHKDIINKYLYFIGTKEATIYTVKNLPMEILRSNDGIKQVLKDNEYIIKDKNGEEQLVKEEQIKGRI